MRLALHWRGKPLLAVDLTAMSPEEPQQDGPPLEAAGHLQDIQRADRMEPDTKTFGFSQRPEASA